MSVVNSTDVPVDGISTLSSGSHMATLGLKINSLDDSIFRHRQQICPWS